jgi:hypothetical protein
MLQTSVQYTAMDLEESATALDFVNPLSASQATGQMMTTITAVGDLGLPIQSVNGAQAGDMASLDPKPQAAETIQVISSANETLPATQAGVVSPEPAKEALQALNSTFVAQIEQNDEVDNTKSKSKEAESASRSWIGVLLDVSIRVLTEVLRVVTRILLNLWHG